MIYVYSDIQDDELLDWFGEIFDKKNYQIVYDYKNGDPKSTISFISNLKISQEFLTPLDKINQLGYHSENSKIVFVRETEINKEICKLIQSTKYTNVHWLLPGYVKGFDNIIFHGWHTNCVRKLYARCKEVLNSFTPYNPKPKYFEALLGTKKTHRDFVYQQLLPYEDKNIIKYHGWHNTKSLKDNQHFIWDDHAEIIDITHSTLNTMYYGESVRLSHIIPRNVYNQTCYSIVTETFIDNNFSFYTEKIAKPIVGKRLFVVFSGQNYLKNLKQLGFKTFDYLIDESYDDVADCDLRFKLAIEQVHKLMTIDQSSVLEKIKDTCEHNYNLLMSNYLDKKMFDSIKKVIDV